jgi:D-alanyl-D-alanine carboxypeptidase
MAFVSYLARFPLSPGGRNFPQLLPANGSGTLRKLANGLPTAGVVRAKTGTLGNAATLAGYLGHQDGVLLVSLMYNGSRVYAARQHQWKLFRMLGAQGVVIPGDSVAVVEALGGDALELPDTLPTPPLPPIEP